MKKLVSVVLAGTMAMTMMAGCGAKAQETTAAAQAETAAAEGAPTGQVAIVTNTVSQNEEEYRSAESMTAKYGDRIVHVPLPFAKNT